MDMGKNQMTQGIFWQCLTSGLWASISSVKLGGILALLFLRSHFYRLCLPGSQVLPSNIILQVKLRTHGSCIGPRRIQVCIDRGPVSHILHLPGRHLAPHIWLKNIPPRWKRQWHGPTGEHSAPLTDSQSSAPSRAIPSGLGVCVCQDGL